ncbi:MAG: hypothetical protein JSW58_03120 [Candidatus Latescibacterota bacterium]|nr:MAG: hypothetical protein JSW58_03120 [Candidatus Latescibacterota bacterium]
MKGSSGNLGCVFQNYGIDLTYVSGGGGDSFQDTLLSKVLLFALDCKEKREAKVILLIADRLVYPSALQMLRGVDGPGTRIVSIYDLEDREGSPMWTVGACDFVLDWYEFIGMDREGFPMDSAHPSQDAIARALGECLASKRDTYGADAACGTTDERLVGEDPGRAMGGAEGLETVDGFVRSSTQTS